MKRYRAVRTFSQDYMSTTKYLNEYLADGYEVVMVTPYMKNGTTEYLEYIIVKEFDK